MTIEEICKAAYENKYVTAKLGTTEKDNLISRAADDLVKNTDAILAANDIDMKNGALRGMAQGLLDRLHLTAERIAGVADGMRQVAALPDPVGEVTKMWKRPNGLIIGNKKVPMGVIGVIYEARPNVTADVFSLCFKTGNTVILRGGSAAANTNQAIVDSLHESLAAAGLPEECVLYIEDTSHESVNEFMKMDKYVDLLIPRGGAGLIRSVVENSTIPVIETGTGNCHIYVDEYADIDMALRITDNAKTQRIGVCNAAESLVVHEKIAPVFLPKLAELFKGRVSLFADEQARKYLTDSYEATDEDFGREYLDYKMSVKTVSDIDEAISHINNYNTGHSEAIITENYTNAQKFLDEIDAACVYVNASTRFTDGNEFGFGAEIGISTQKLHARGPMGLDALLSSKYIIYGNGQIRE
ncbi:MAG: glutamate-5-semialdehyde dehydrogenase [Lachnospiraceae bacterium]|nr:glutamate-5-semialdehyde dehydrogenase [Lachnospiraceae bacterium]